MSWSDRKAQAKNQKTEELKSEFYLKFGQYQHNKETDELDFVSIPQPLYLDTMAKNQIRGEGAFQELLCDGNDLLEDLLNYAKVNLKPGEDEDIELTVKLCRKKSSQEVNHIKKSFSFIKK